MTRIRAWLIRRIFGVAPTTAPDSDGEKREDHPERWKAGDEIVGIPAGNGWVYLNREAAEHYGLDMLAKINNPRSEP